MRYLLMALCLVVLVARASAVVAAPLEPLQAAPGQVAALLPCAPALAPGLSSKPAGKADRLCRAVAVALLGPALFSDAAVALSPGHKTALPRLVQQWASSLAQGQPRVIVTAYATNSVWAERMQAAAANYGRLFHPGAGLDHVALPAAPAFPWADPAT